MSQGEKLNYARPRTRSYHVRSRSFRGLARDGFVASASAAVVAFLVLFSIAAPSSKLDAHVGPVVPRPGNDAVVEGRVLASNGGALEGAEVVVARGGRARATTRSRDDGTFRLNLRGGCSVYTVSVRAKANGDDVATARRARLCPGDSLPVDARVVTHGNFIWVPGPR